MCSILCHEPQRPSKFADGQGSAQRRSQEKEPDDGHSPARIHSHSSYPSTFVLLPITGGYPAEPRAAPGDVKPVAGGFFPQIVIELVRV